MSWFDIIDYLFKGIILVGGAYLFFFLRHSYEARIKILEVTQIDKFVDQMKKFKEFYEHTIEGRDQEIISLRKEMEYLEMQNLSKDEIIKSQKNLLDNFRNKLTKETTILWERFFDSSIKSIDVESYKDFLPPDFKDIKSRMWTIKFKEGEIPCPKENED